MIYDVKLVDLEEHFGNWCQNERKNSKGNAAQMTKERYPYDNIFSPVRVNRLTIKNRVVMAPMGNLQMCEQTGRPNDKMLEYFFARAKGGTGLLTTGLIPVSHGIDHSVTEPGNFTLMPRIDGTMSVFAGWRDLAQGVHAYGSKIFIQITPGLGRVGPPTCLLEKFQFPVSASFNPNFYIPEIPCMRLSDFKLRRIIKNCGQAAADAKEMGMDGVYLHGHEGYLLEQMTNPAFNRRVLGKYTDPEKFGLDIIKEIRNRCGPAFPIMYRIDLSLALNETYRDKMNTVPSLKKFKNGRTIKQTLEYMKHLVEAGVDLFDVDLGCYDNWWLPHPPAGMPAGCFLDVSKIAKDYFKQNNVLSNAGVEVPIVAVGKLGYPDMADKAIADGDCDMVMLGRPLLSDPDWCNKAYAGKVEDIRPCIGCQEGCVNEFILGGHPQCAINPRTGFEHLLPEIPAPAEAVKNVAVVGAGPAGIVFALTAAKRGHKVTLYEKDKEIGGKLIIAGAAKIKYDVQNYLEYLRIQVKKQKNITVKTGTAVDVEFLKKNKFDTVVFAYGTKEICPPFKGMDKVKTVMGLDLLADPSLMKDAQKIVIAGGGVVACETAYWAKYEFGKDVTVVEMLPNFMTGVCTANRGHLLHYLEKADVEMLNATKVMSFGENKVNVLRNISDTVPNPFNTWTPLLPGNVPNPLAKDLGPEEEEMSIDADLVVIALGGRPDQTMYFDAVKANVAPEILNVGDSERPGRVLEAARAAYRSALKI